VLRYVSALEIANYREFSDEKQFDSH
jgi:hypothetical protein